MGFLVRRLAYSEWQYFRSYRGSSGDSLSESPLLPHHTTPIDAVIPNEYAIRRRSEESPFKENCILAQKEIHIVHMIPDTLLI